MTRSFVPLIESLLCLLLVTAAATGQEATRPRPEIERLRELRQEDPVAYQAEVARLRQQLQQRMQELKQRDPAAHRKFKARMQAQHQRRLRQEHNRDPEHFRQRMEQRLEAVKARDPVLYERINKRRQQWREERMRNTRLRDGNGRPNTSHPLPRVEQPAISNLMDRAQGRRGDGMRLRDRLEDAQEQDDRIPRKAQRGAGRRRPQ